MSKSTLPPTPETAAEAKAALRTLSAFQTPRQPVTLRAEGSKGASAVVPRQAFDLLLEILGQMANGNAVTIVPIHAEFTTQEAADFLNMSRPFLVSLLEAGKLPFRKVGTHRRVLFEDLLNYRQAADLERRKTLDELAAEAQRLQLGY